MTRIIEGEAPMFRPRLMDHDTVDFTEKLDDEFVGISVTAGWSTVDEDVKLVMVEVDSDAGDVRVYYNDAVAWGGSSIHSLATEYAAALETAEGDSNDDEIAAWRALAESALATLGIDTHSIPAVRGTDGPGTDDEDDHGCVYGHSGSRVSACDQDGVTTRGGFWYCAAHAAWWDLAELHQDDPEG